MSIIRSKQKIYNSNSKKMTPVWKLDTIECMVIYFDERTLTEKRTYYYTDYIIAHLRYVSSKNPDRLRKLVDNGKIIEYLDDIETKAIEAVDRQVEKWKKSDKEYQIALESGDIVKAAQLLNCLEAMAKEIIFDCIIYV